MDIPSFRDRVWLADLFRSDAGLSSRTVFHYLWWEVMSTEKEILRGKLCYASNGEESELLGLLKEDHHVSIVAVELSNIYRKFVTVRYVISDVEIPEDQITEAIVRHLTGAPKFDYGMRYSELTGYLWTDENLQVGGHDLLTELKSNVGKYLHLEIKSGKGDSRETT